MGHRSSKSAIANSSPSADLYVNHNTTLNSTQTTETPARRPTELWNISNSNGNNNSTSSSSSNRIPIPLPGTTINVQIQESPTIDVVQQAESDSSSLNSLQNRQIIIKIQLAKMEENANESATATATTNATTSQQQPEVADTSVNAAAAMAMALDTNKLENIAAANNSLSSSSGKQIVNLTLNGNFIYADESGVTSELASLSSTSSRNSRTAGGSTNLTNNNHNKNNLNKSTNLAHNNSDLQIRLNALHIQEDWEQQQQLNDAMPEYCEVLEESVLSTDTAASSSSMHGGNVEPRHSETSLPDTVGCLSARRKTKTAARPSSTSSLSSVMLSRRRCRDAIRRILEPTSKSSSNKHKEQQNNKHSENATLPPPLPALPSTSKTVLPNSSGRPVDMRRQSLNQNLNQQKLNVTTTSSTASNNLMPISITTVGAAGVGAAGATTSGIATNACGGGSTSSSIWTPSRNDIIIPITSPPQFVVVQCAPSSVVTLGRIDDNAIRLTSTDVGSTVNGFSVGGSVSNAFAATTNLTRSMSNGPIVHSQVDFVHCLVPDLDKIVNSSFYWGKIDRYEAERLLEGKPEGTFLLRDSAQEEYLFSVTFRKYGRSLHARIEQSGHKFGFDCHDPGVFTAPTVTGLLQHYKDPACVMFFEPMLTIPLHRKTVFSLQELARASIVSNTTYDGVNELGLPVRVKSFLKEYHYKQKLRVKPCDEPFYSCT